MNKSRLSRRLERQTKRSLVITLFGIFLIIAFLVKFGIAIISSVTSYIINAKNDNTGNNSTTLTSFVAPPVLDSIPTATNSAYIIVSGKALKDQTIALYLNDELTSKEKVDKNNHFSFGDVKINQSENTVKVKAITKDNKESEFSPSVTVVYRNSTPSLTLDSPTDGQSFSKEDKFANVSGKTDPQFKVTVNDFWAVVDTTGKFSYNLPLQSGENKIKVIATDEAGNKTEVERKVTYSP